MFFGKFKWAEDAVLLDSQIETVLALAAKRVRKGTAKENLTVGGGLRFAAELNKLDHSHYQENAMLSGDEDIALIDIPRDYKTIATAEKDIVQKIKQANGHLIAVNEDQNMDILIRLNDSLDEAASEKAVKETSSDGTSAEIHAAALANIEHLLRKARLGVSHRDWHTYAKNQQRGTNKETALQIHRFYTAMQYGDDIYGVKMTVREKQNGSTVFYTLEAHDLDIEKINPGTESSRGGVVKAALPGRSPAIKYSTFFEKFKPIDDLLGLKYKEKYSNVRFSIAPEGDQTETAAFKKWFDGSKVVDENGEPLVVYHGTNADFNIFDKEKFGLWDNGSKFRITGTDENGKLKFETLKDEGFFFTAQKGEAKDHAEGAAEMAGGSARIIKAYLKAENPLVIEMDKYYAEVKRYTAQDWYDKHTGEILDQFHAGNYDSIIIKNPLLGTAGNMYIVFEPNQIKSATDNIGTFDPENPDIRFSLEEYSESEQDDIVAVLQVFVGRNMDMEPEKYREYLRSKGIQIPDQDADIFFRMAVMANDKAARERANRLRDQWIFENFPIFAEVAEFAGGSDFKIKPVGHEGEVLRLYAITEA